MRTVWVSFDVIGRRCLEACAEAGAEVAAVVTLPGPIDPNRSGQCSFDDLGVPVIETEDVNSPQTVAAVREAAPDAIFVVGWSQLIRGELLEVAPQGMFGMHPTLLPRHRGRAAIPWTILSGVARTGVTLFEIVDPSADSGPIVGRREVEVAPDETATTLYDKLLEAHVELIREHVPQIAAGTAPREPQDVKRASAWPKRRRPTASSTGRPARPTSTTGSARRPVPTPARSRTSATRSWSSGERGRSSSPPAIPRGRSSSCAPRAPSSRAAKGAFSSRRSSRSCRSRSETGSDERPRLRGASR